jgi:hypothetical protein
MRGSFNPIIFRFCQRNLNIKLVLLLPNPATYTIKQKAHQLLDELPDSATWEDLIYQNFDIEGFVPTSKLQ